jgi:hypothetical protein
LKQVRLKLNIKKNKSVSRTLPVQRGNRLFKSTLITCRSDLNKPSGGCKNGSRAPKCATGWNGFTRVNENPQVFSLFFFPDPPGSFGFIVPLINAYEPGSSVSIGPGYGLDDRAIEFRSPAEEKRFFCNLCCVQTSSKAHPASCAMGNMGPFLGAKAQPGSDTDHSPHLVPRSRMSRSYFSSPPKRLLGV